MAKAKYTRGADGYFSTKVWDGTYNPVTGQKNRKNLRTKKSSKALEDMVNEYKANVSERKNIRKADITFLQYARKWEEVYKAQRSNATKAMYDNIIEKHFSCIEYVKLQDIDRMHLQIMLNNADGKKKIQQQIMLTFKQVLRSAVADRLFPANVMEDIFQNIEPVKYSAKEKRALTPEEKYAVFKADFQEQDRIFIYLIYGCGLRREEALALTIFDFNLPKREISINKAHDLTHGTPVQKEPKTKNGYRIVPIPDKIYHTIASYVSSLKSKGHTYLFTMRDWKPMTKSSYDKMWKRILKAIENVTGEPAAGLTAHVFRHNYCTNLCYQIPQISIKKIAQLMGDTEAVVLKVYNHIILEKEDAAAAVNEALNF